MSAFDHAMAGLYATFETSKPEEILGCYCCLGAIEREVLLSKPLGALTGDELSAYASSVFLTLGDASDYRYFLPRIFELSATDLDWWPSPEVVGGGLVLADWANWSDRERQAIEIFFAAWLDRWASQRLSERRWDEIDSLLCGIARAGLHIAPYLERLLIPTNLLGLRELDSLNDKAAAEGHSAQNFWEDSPDSWKRLTDFLTSTAVRERLSAPG